MNILAIVKKSALKKQALEAARKVTLVYRGQSYSKVIV
jgi:hypothetical protein